MTSIAPEVKVKHLSYYCW